MNYEDIRCCTMHDVWYMIHDMPYDTRCIRYYTLYGTYIQVTVKYTLILHVVIVGLPPSP